MLLSTSDSIAGYKIERHVALVQGSTVRSKHVGRDMMAGLKGIVGGELKGYTELLVESREQCIARMVEQAQAQGANAIVAIRLSTSAVTQQAAEVLAYGTAVVVSPQ